MYTLKRYNCDQHSRLCSATRRGQNWLLWKQIIRKRLFLLQTTLVSIKCVIATAYLPNLKISF